MGGQEPDGGHDSTPLRPSSEPTYTLKFTFHKATNLPVADLNTRSSDPYFLAQLNTPHRPRHKNDPYLRYRSPTIQQSTEPEWETPWIVAGVPQSGFVLKIRVFDEDPDDHDDFLGRVKIEQHRIGEEWKGFSKKEFKIHKSGANFRAYTLRSCMAATHKDIDLHGGLWVSCEVLGRTKEECGKAYTVNSFYRIHYSPVIGKMAGTKAKGDDGVEKVVFQANEIQFKGPVPNELYHRFVDFKSFVHGMFEATGIRGRILHKALHKQHSRVYIYNKQTKYGEFDGPGEAMTKQFLDMVHYDQGARIFTYVITLDGLFRFTETGKEFGIDLLSKHTMHSDVNIYIAWSGEFLVRRISNPEKPASDPSQRTHPTSDLPDGPPDSPPSKDPSHYELIIDNDSGTYRPQEKLLPVLQRFLEKQFPGLQILTKSCTDKELDKIKDSQRDAKKKEGEGMVVQGGSMSDVGRRGSISSSHQEDLDERAEDVASGSKGGGRGGGLQKGVDFLEKPKQAFSDLIPGHKEKMEREAAEQKEDQAS